MKKKFCIFLSIAVLASLITVNNAFTATRQKLTFTEKPDSAALESSIADIVEAPICMIRDSRV